MTSGASPRGSLSRVLLRLRDFHPPRRKNIRRKMRLADKILRVASLF